MLCNNIDGSFECRCPPGTVLMDDECLGKFLLFILGQGQQRGEELGTVPQSAKGGQKVRMISYQNNPSWSGAENCEKDR